MEELLQADIDNSAVDRFAQAMKDKLAKAREKGRGGWDDKTECTDEHLAKLFFEHLEKTNDGNLIDLANFLMFLSERGADGSVLVNNNPRIAPNTCSTCQHYKEKRLTAWFVTSNDMACTKYPIRPTADFGCIFHESIISKVKVTDGE